MGHGLTRVQIHSASEHDQVERGGGGVCAGSLGQPFLHGPNGNRLALQSADVVREDAAERQTRVDHQHGSAIQVGLGVSPTGPGGQSETRREPECAPLTRLAHHLELTAHHRYELRRDGEPDPCAAELTGGRGVRLRESREDPLLQVVVDADARIPHLETQGDRGVLRSLDDDPNLDLPALRELHRVVHQVHQHLPQPAAVSNEAPRNVERLLVDELDPLLRGPHRQGLEAVSETLVQVERSRPELERPRTGSWRSPGCR